jgi:hypothetical protein
MEKKNQEATQMEENEFPGKKQKSQPQRTGFSIV